MFREIRKYNMRLNTKKYTFGVEGKKFLSFMITYHGIEANADKCKIVLEMHNPTNVREV